MVFIVKRCQSVSDIWGENQLQLLALVDRNVTLFLKRFNVDLHNSSHRQIERAHFQDGRGFVLKHIKSLQRQAFEAFQRQ